MTRPLDRYTLEQAALALVNEFVNATWHCKRCSLILKVGEPCVSCGDVAETAPVAPSDTPKTDLESIPEYFDKPGVLDGLSTAHPVLLVRQMANEIIRLRAELLAWQDTHARLDAMRAKQSSEARAVPEGWKLVCEKCGADYGTTCGWPSNCPTGLAAAPSGKEKK